MRTGRGGLTKRCAALLAVLLAAGAAWFASAPAASAHALVVGSDPVAGASLSQLPKTVTLTFSEEIVPSLCGLEVVDSAGHVVTRGVPHAVPGNALQLTIALPTLLGGVYTVHWNAVSRDDGHASSGSFTFGVGPLAYAAMAGPAPELVSAPSSASPAVVAGRWIFDVGLGLLVGGCWIALYGFAAAGRRTLFLALGGAGALVAGLALAGWGQARADRIGLDELASTSLGLGLLAQAVPGAAAGGCIALALRTRASVRRWLLTAGLILAATAIAAHALTTHAASSTPTDLEIAAQWAHVAAFATWIGGLAALLVALGLAASPEKAAAVRRFSVVAGYALAALCLSGAVRALNEVGAWSALTHTLFGRLVVAKVALAGALTGLGAYNRYRSVPAAARSLNGLRRVGSTELGVAALALVAAATLSSSLPPALAHAAAAQPWPPHLVVQGSTKGVRASLEISPGYPGPNRFTLRAYDAASGRALTGRATLAFRLPDRPDVPAATLDLDPAADGSLLAVGSQLTLTGQWTVTADLDLPGGRAQIPFTVACTLSPQQIQQMTMGRMTMVYGIRLAGGRQLEAYLTPGRPGNDALHLVFTDQRNGQIALSAPPVVTFHRDGSTASRGLAMRQVGTNALTRGDFFGAATFTGGRWDFHVGAAEPDGTRLVADFALTVG